MNILFINSTGGLITSIDSSSFKKLLSSSIFSPTFITVSLSNDLTINSNYFLLSRYTAFLVDKNNNNMVIPISQTCYNKAGNKQEFITNILNGIIYNTIGGETNNNDFAFNTSCIDYKVNIIINKNNNNIEEIEITDSDASIVYEYDGNDMILSLEDKKNESYSLDYHKRKPMILFLYTKENEPKVTLILYDLKLNRGNKSIEIEIKENEMDMEINNNEKKCIEHIRFISKEKYELFEVKYEEKEEEIKHENIAYEHLPKVIHNLIFTFLLYGETTKLQQMCHFFLKKKNEMEKYSQHKQPHGKIETYYKKEKIIKSEENYKEGEKEGIQKIWYKNKQLIYEENYKKGKKDGKQKMCYSSNGQLMYEENYKEGEKEGIQKRWYDDGKIRHEENYKKGKKHGTQQYYFKNEQFNYEEIYKNGKREYTSKENPENSD